MGGDAQRRPNLGGTPQEGTDVEIEPDAATSQAGDEEDKGEQTDAEDKFPSRRRA
jgi:hypothetical protein